MTEVKTVKPQTMTERYAQVLLVQKIANVVLGEFKAKKSEKISAIKPEVQYVSGEKGAVTRLTFTDEDKEANIELTDTQVNGIDLDSRIIGKFSVNDVDKLGKVVQDQANNEIKRAVKMSASSKTNPNMYRPAKGTHAKKPELMF